MGCVFCASGLDGLARNLTTGEIVEQMLRLQRLLAPDERLSHIVVMGMGEPLANLDNLLPALEEASREDGLGISARRITISTVGLPKADAPPRRRRRRAIGSPSRSTRRTTSSAARSCPSATRSPLADILAEADHYFDLSGRQLTFEYVLLAGINDSPEHAARTRPPARRPHGAGERDPLQSGRRPAVSHAVARRPSKPSAASSKTTASRSASATSKGDAIDAACGQLRRRMINETTTLQS